jgi:tRNA(Ile2) C34 agmatinyltransferase TiaS
MESIVLFVMAIGLIAFLITGTVMAKRYERQGFNNGICPFCKEPLKYFDTDSHGDRGYTCDKCNYTTWVSYNADKDYRRQRKK